MNLFKSIYTNKIEQRLSIEPWWPILGIMTTLSLMGAFWYALHDVKILSVILATSLSVLILGLTILLYLSYKEFQSLQNQLLETQKEPKFITELGLKFKKEDILSDHFAPYCPKNNCYENQMRFTSYPHKSHTSNFYNCPNCDYTHELRNFDGKPSNVKDELEFVKWRLNRSKH